MKRFLSFFLIGILFCSGILDFVVEAELPYRDLDDVPWAYEAISYFYTTTVFLHLRHEAELRPHDRVQRAEAIAFIIRSFNLTEDETQDNFNDVLSRTWYYPVVGFAKKMGFVFGDDNNNFYPERYITREEYATMLYRIAMEFGASFPDNSEVESFKDMDISDYAKEAIIKMHECDIIHGYSDEYFLPKKDLSRAECIKMTYELLKYLDLLVLSPSET